MTTESTALDDLERRLTVLEARLPGRRSNDEQDAATAMFDCMRELRRLASALPDVRSRYLAAHDADEDEAWMALRRLIHDLRTPAGVLYTYLRLVADGVIFAESQAEQRAEAFALAGLINAVREQTKVERRVVEHAPYET